MWFIAPERQERDSAGTRPGACFFAGRRMESATESSTCTVASASREPLTLADFQFDLPAERIAQTPAAERDQARLLVYDRQTGTASTPASMHCRNTCGRVISWWSTTPA